MSGGYSLAVLHGPLLLLWSRAPGRAASVAEVHGLSRSAARGIFQDQGWNPRPTAKSALAGGFLPMVPSGSPMLCFLNLFCPLSRRVLAWG